MAEGSRNGSQVLRLNNGERKMRDTYQAALELVSREMVGEVAVRFKMNVSDGVATGYEQRAKVGDIVGGFAITKSRFVPVRFKDREFIPGSIEQGFRTLLGEIAGDISGGQRLVSCLPVRDESEGASAFIVRDDRTGIIFEVRPYPEHRRFIDEISSAWGVAPADAAVAA